MSFWFRLMLLTLPLALLGCGADDSAAPDPTATTADAGPDGSDTDPDPGDGDTEDPDPDPDPDPDHGSVDPDDPGDGADPDGANPDGADPDGADPDGEDPNGENPEPSELANAVYYETLPPGSELPDEAECAEEVAGRSSTEARPENIEANNVVVDVTVDIDGADEVWNAAFAPRITGDFTGTTEQILRWAACKWGFDEDVTRARAVTESSWRVGIEGDESDDPAECAVIGLDAPCAQSYGLLQVKGTVHEGTYPATTRSSAFGVDYAMAWLRSCYEGSFIWLGDDYAAGDEFGCVGAWFSGNWWDQPANDYAGEVRFHLQERTWESYGA